MLVVVVENSICSFDDISRYNEQSDICSRLPFLYIRHAVAEAEQLQVSSWLGGPARLSFGQPSLTRCDQTDLRRTT
jgi:hypothetical protein